MAKKLDGRNDYDDLVKKGIAPESGTAKVQAARKMLSRGNDHKSTHA
jgi:hypothetical protein